MTQIKMPEGEQAHSHQVIVVGAGVSGLAAASYLVSKGRKVVVLEARDRIGGRIDSRHTGHGGERVDMGASYVHGMFDNPIEKLCEELGIERKFAEDQVALGPKGPIDPKTTAKVAGNVLGTFFNFAKEHAQSTDPPIQASLADFIYNPKSPIYHHLSEEGRFWATALSRAFSGWTGAELDQVSLAWWGFERDTEGPDRMITKGQYHRVVDHLADIVGRRFVHLGQEVVNFRQNDDCVEVVTKSNDGTKQTWKAAHVVCSLPLGVLKASKDKLFEPALPPRKVRAINQLGFGLLSKIALRYENVWWETSAEWTHSEVFFILPEKDDPRALLPPGSPEELTARGIMVINQHSVSHQPILLLMLGADLGRHVESLPQETATSWADSLVRKYIGHNHPREKVESMITSWSTDPYAHGAYTFIPPGGPTPLDLAEFAVPAWEDRLGFAGEHTHADRYASVHGAYESGLREGKRVDIALTLQEMEGEE